MKQGLMKNCLVVGLAVLSLACAASAQSATAPAKTLSPLEQAVIGAEKNFLVAVKKSDADFFKRTLTADYSFVGFDGQLSDRDAALDELDEAEITPYDFKVVAAGDNTAIVTYDAIVQVPPSEDQGPPPRYQHFSSVWVKHAGVWKLKFQQTTPTHWGDW